MKSFFSKILYPIKLIWGKLAIFDMLTLDRSREWVRYTTGREVTYSDSTVTMYQLLDDGDPTIAITSHSAVRNMHNSCDIDGGVFIGGEFVYGTYHGGVFHSGKFMGGHYYLGEFHAAGWCDGSFSCGVFYGGEFHGRRRSDADFVEYYITEDGTPIDCVTHVEPGGYYF